MIVEICTHPKHDLTHHGLQDRWLDRTLPSANEMNINPLGAIFSERK